MKYVKNNTMSEIYNCSICSAEMYKMFEYRMFSYFRCPICQHVTTFPYPTELQIKQHYSQAFKEGNYYVARKYNKIYKSVMSEFVKTINKALLRQGKSIVDSSILDVGCFTGEFLYQMAQAGANVCGIELQDEAVKIANEKLPGKIIKADIMDENATLPQFQFDIVTLFGIIEHVKDPIFLLERATKFLKAGGLLAIQTPSSKSFLAGVMRKYWPPYTPIEHIHIFSFKSLALIYKKLGLKNIIFKRHWKKLSAAYAHSMLRTFGPEFHKIFKPFYNVLPNFITTFRFPFYIGEIVVLANR